MFSLPPSLPDPSALGAKLQALRIAAANPCSELLTTDSTGLCKPLFSSQTLSQTSPSAIGYRLSAIPYGHRRSMFHPVGVRV